MNEQILWRPRGQLIDAAVMTLCTGQHWYVSTACLHGKHEHCRSVRAVDGTVKDPGTCKFCPAVCLCRTCRHTDQPQARWWPWEG